ncbi:dihydrofolate reductase family protein [Flindersiella endophytica]
MGHLVWDVSVSVDGFVAGPNINPRHPLGENGELLHEWMAGGDPGHGVAVVDEVHATTGAVIMGRRTFDTGIGPWGDVPFPVSCYVLTHRARPPLPQARGSFRFVTEGIAVALEQATAAAGGRDVVLMGGETGWQYLASGLVDQLRLHVAPVLLGTGVRLFDSSKALPIRLDGPTVSEGNGVTHLSYRIR